MRSSAEEILKDYVSKNLLIKEIKISGKKIRYVKLGNNKHVLILIHGATFGWGQWYPNISYLSKYFTVYALDLPGCGKSGYINFYSNNIFEYWVKTLSIFISKLKINKFSLIGYSTGGFVASKLASKIKHKINKLILVSPVGLGSRTPFKYKLLSIPILEIIITKIVFKKDRKSWKEFLLDGMKNKKKMPSEFLNYIVETSLEEKWQSPFKLMSKLLSLNGVKSEFQIVNDLINSNIRTLIIFGENDKSLSASEAQKNISNNLQITFNKYSNTGHVPSVEKSVIFNKEVCSFLLSN